MFVTKRVYVCGLKSFYVCGRYYVCGKIGFLFLGKCYICGWFTFVGVTTVTKCIGSPRDSGICCYQILDV